MATTVLPVESIFQPDDLPVIEELARQVIETARNSKKVRKHIAKTGGNFTDCSDFCKKSGCLVLKAKTILEKMGKK